MAQLNEIAGPLSLLAMTDWAIMRLGALTLGRRPARVLTARNGPRAVTWIGHGEVLAVRGRRTAAPNQTSNLYIPSQVLRIPK
jgi:hypothetical protein